MAWQVAIASGDSGVRSDFTAGQKGFDEGSTFFDEARMGRFVGKRIANSVYPH
ncbi:hypothetical protein GCM10007901_05940 [Dyella acidisoli]|uniref:Uncharacterized protein n=1 Tax=Dyella acidisoli TaxID=1867834 RepID=A0ABQ5XKC5_9GAMM|nr:hypothetical protein GCM10007901_05940 [Dyella acidisoli]